MPAAGRGALRCSSFRRAPKSTTTPKWPPSCAPARAQQAIEHGCTPIAGSEAVYFGADQPRITAEALIPWAALGAPPPSAGTSLRVEAAVTSWDRDRWMSLSGRPPGAAMGDPAEWRRMRLGDGPRMIESAPILPPPAHG